MAAGDPWGVTEDRDRPGMLRVTFGGGAAVTLDPRDAVQIGSAMATIGQQLCDRDGK